MKRILTALAAILVIAACSTSSSTAPESMARAKATSANSECRFGYTVAVGRTDTTCLDPDQ